MQRKNTVAKIGDQVVSFAGGNALALLEQLLTVDETAGILRCSVHSLNKWRLTGGGPAFVYVGSRVRYRRADLASFIANSTRRSTSDHGGLARAATT
jgi:molybdenum cofactor biosynthesis enzyme MoaA